MKFSLALFLLLSAAASYSVQWEIVGQDSQTPVYSGELEADLTESVGHYTVKILDAQKIPYIGSIEGINSILSTPTGEEAMFVESEERLRAYGWCYKINGVNLETMPDKAFFFSQDAKLTWYFAYVTYEAGEWKNFCTPAYLNPLPKVH